LATKEKTATLTDPLVWKEGDVTGLGKQAKTLSDVQVRTLLRHVEGETAFPKRNRVVVLSFRAGLRKEVAGLRWQMVSDTEGQVSDSLALTNGASKGRSGRVIPLHTELRAALVALHAHEQSKGRGAPDDFVAIFTTGSTDSVVRSNSVQFLFRSWFRKLGFAGASSHSGRRSFITRAARKISEVGGSIRDVQALAGHSSIATTQRYIDVDPQAQRKLIDRL
jgi:integrase/recombinase XerD